MTKRTELGLEIEAGLDDAIAFVRGKVARSVRRAEAPSADHVKSVRKKAAKSRPEFERLYGIPERTLRAWESGQSTPDMTARSFLAMPFTGSVMRNSGGISIPLIHCLSRRICGP